MNAPVALEQTRRSVLITMATKYGMEPAAFEQTLRATVFPANGSKEQFAAFLVVANEYGLNPITKEIYAFPTRGGGVQPIVSVDGWCNLINSHPKLNGFEFDDHLAQGKVTAITARIWRKDRDKPIVVTEYMEECKRDTEPWNKFPRRMLRHKSLIQCARYAFGFAGIVDPDEAERMGADVSQMRDVTPSRQEPPRDSGPPMLGDGEPEAAQDDIARVESGLDDGKEVVWGDDLPWDEEKDGPGFLQREDPAKPLIDTIAKIDGVKDLTALAGDKDYRDKRDALSLADQGRVHQAFQKRLTEIRPA